MPFFTAFLIPGRPFMAAVQLPRCRQRSQGAYFRIELRVETKISSQTRRVIGDHRTVQKCGETAAHFAAAFNDGVVNWLEFRRENLAILD